MAWTLLNSCSLYSCSLYIIYSGFVKILEILDCICISPKKSIFWNFGGQNSKISKIRDSRILSLDKKRPVSSFICILKLDFFGIYQRFSTFRPRMGCSDVIKTCITKKIDEFPSFLHTRCTIVAREGMQSFASLARRVFELFRIIDRDRDNWLEG